MRCTQRRRGKSFAGDSLGPESLRQPGFLLQLREEQRGTRGLLDLVEVAIVELDQDGEVRLVNRKGCEILRRDERQIVGKDWFTTFLPERMREEVRSVYRKLMSGDGDPVEYYENPVLIPDGQERIVAWHNTMLRDDAGRPAGTLSSGIDITDRKRTEEELRRREALARIGQLAAVVAHEVRNPLAGISGALQIIRGRLGATGPDYEIMGEILERIEALNSMVGALLRYANPRPPRVESVQIDRLVEDAKGKICHVAFMRSVPSALFCEIDDCRALNSALSILIDLPRFEPRVDDAFPHRSSTSAHLRYRQWRQWHDGVEWRRRPGRRVRGSRRGPDQLVAEAG